MKYETDEKLFRQLSMLDPADVCSRTLCRYDEQQKQYSFSFWNEEYIISPLGEKVECSTMDIRKQHEYLPIFLVNYLIQAGGKTLCGELVSEKDIPGGSTFFRGPHEIPTTVIASRYQNDLDAFSRRCEELYGLPINMADKAYAFQATPRISFAVLYWQGDNEFPPESKILYDKSFAVDVTLDTIFAIAVEICFRFIRP